jgi:hypothetical protein
LPAVAVVTVTSRHRRLLPLSVTVTTVALITNVTTVALVTTVTAYVQVTASPRQV